MSQGVPNTNVGITPSSKVTSIFPGDYAAADEGSFFVSYLAATASNAVSLTSQVLANANPILAIQNQAPLSGNSYNLYIRAIKVVVTTVITGNSQLYYSTALDPLAVKLTTVGTPFNTPQNTNSNSAVMSKAALWGGVNIAAAVSANGRQTGAGIVSGALPVAFDEYIFHFGQPVFGGDMVGTQTLVKRITVSNAPLIVPPQWWFTLGFWAAAWTVSAAPAFQMEVQYIERPSGL